MSTGFLRADGTQEVPLSERWREWLPSLQQMSNALQLQLDEPVGPAATENEAASSPLATSMRQGLGMICCLALLAGLIPFLVQWISAGRVGVVVPLAILAEWVDGRQGMGAQTGVGPLGVIVETGRTIAGLEPAILPGWLAAGLSALGLWINWPLRWLTLWLAYGLGVLVVARAWGASSATLQRFYALTSYAALPLLLTGLGVIPCLGVLAQLIAYLWAFLIYLQAVRTTTGLDMGKAIVSTLAPAALVLVVSSLVFASLVVTLLSLMVG